MTQDTRHVIQCLECGYIFPVNENDLYHKDKFKCENCGNMIKLRYRRR
jgi:rRNA maturation endonuclease Nob1